MQVLLIDDDSGVRKVLSRMLRRAGHQVIEASNGLEGIARLRASPVDLVLTDIMMPAMNGIEFIKAARQLCPSLRVIAMSGGGRTTSADYLQQAGELGAIGTLHKPFTSADLQTLIDACCAAEAQDAAPTGTDAERSRL
jgi:CheY-like chemotaxis protein